jgi:hypothetical protein
VVETAGADCVAEPGVADDIIDDDFIDDTACFCGGKEVKEC